MSMIEKGVFAMDFLYSGAFVRAVSTGAVALYQHLGPAQHLLPLRPVFGLCWNVLGLSDRLLARRHQFYPGEIHNAHCWRLARSHGSPITFEVWTRQGTWFWYVVNPQRTGGTIGAAATETEAIREAHSSIEEMSARPARVAASQVTGDAAALEESNLNPTASSLASSWVGAGPCGESTRNCRSSKAKRKS
jgi:hypothetical protein